MAFDCAIVGGGIIGLSVAYELSNSKQSIAVIDAQKSRTKASWAAAGIIPPASLEHSRDAIDNLRALSRPHLESWSWKLKATTNIDPEFQSCGAIHVARHPGESVALSANVAQWRSDGIQVDSLTEQQARILEPALTQDTNFKAYHTPDEAAIRPPRLLQALRQACLDRGVELIDDEFMEWIRESANHTSARTANHGKIEADRYCVTAGAWSQSIARQLDLAVEIKPWRGQMLSLETAPGTVSKVIYEGPNYLVPRKDGIVLVGSTMEDVDFDDETTDQAIKNLRRFATELVPPLAEATELDRWAGIRPGTSDGMPYIGASPSHENIFVATGHLRNGIAMSAGTAVLVARLMNGEPLPFNISDFRVSR